MQHRCTDWKPHKKWLREAVEKGIHPVTAAQRHGIERTTAWRICQSPRVRKYLASLDRWDANKSLQARIDAMLAGDTFPDME
jgi:hypothetical protein